MKKGAQEMMDSTEVGSIEWAHTQLKDAADNLNEWRQDASECYDFYAGIQWSDEDRQILEEERNRQTVTFDRITKTINTVSGVQIQNRQEIRFFPRQIGQANVNEGMTSAVRWARDQSTAEHEESEAFLDMLTTGMGWIHTTINADEQDAKIEIMRLDPLECLWDPAARKTNLSDSKWRASIKGISSADLEAQYPDIDMDLASTGTRYLDFTMEPIDATPPRYQMSQTGGDDASRTEYELINFEYWEHEPYYQVIDEQGQLQSFGQEEWQKLKPIADKQGLKYQKRKRKAYKQMIFVGKAIIYQGPAGTQKGFTLKAVTGLRNRNKNTWFGLVRLMIDPQRWSNKWLSQILHIVNSNAKGGILAETDAFENVRKAEDSWARADSITWMRPGGLGKIQEKSFGQIPAGVDRLLQYGMEAIDAVSGVNAEMMGANQNDQPAILEEGRKRAAITVIAKFFDSMQLYYKEEGHVLIDLIRTYIADGRLIRIMGESGEQYLPLVKDQMTEDYDIIVDEAPSSPYLKERAFGTLMQIIPLALQAQIPIPPQILEYAPLPESLINKWRQMLQPKEPDPKQQAEEEQRKQIEMATAAAAAHQIESQAKLNEAMAVEKAKQFDLNEQKIRIQAAQAGFDAQLEKLKYEMEVALADKKAEIEQDRLKVEAAKAGFDAQLRKQQQEFDMAMAKLNLMKEAITCESTAVTGESMGRPIMAENLANLVNIAHGGTSLGEVKNHMEEQLIGHAMAIKQLMEGMMKLHQMVGAPRKREIVRDKKGRALYAIDRVDMGDIDEKMH